ncbi:MAG: c-type cytochrome, partial [Acidobacteria bacterium]|nr:c-type cytochrome [Acidobacteriota bacterium]
MMQFTRGYATTSGLAALAALIVLRPAVAAGQGAGGEYTADQADAGRAVYERECAECHQTNLQGSFEAPPLAGESFLNFWGDLTASDLYDRISSSMPPEQPDSLGEAAYLDVVAYLLQANGAPAGSAPLTADAAVTIAAAASAEQPAASAPARVDAAAAAAGQPTEELGEGGITVEGEVANFRPVTDAMLRNQDPGDWLMIRRNYEAWSHSPLDGIDRGNVGELELAWVWAL